MEYAGLVAKKLNNKLLAFVENILYRVSKIFSVKYFLLVDCFYTCSSANDRNASRILNINF